MTGALSPVTINAKVMHVLDICMAPGGYTAYMLGLHPKAQTFAITLPTSQGGHTLHIPKKELAGFREVDVTLYFREFSDRNISDIDYHPGKLSFSTLKPFIFYKMDIVFCDGMVLRTQERPDYRDNNEKTRLACSQLILGLQRIARGGTFIMLLSKADSWDSADILYKFDISSDVQLFKPAKMHATRSSFYMIVKEVDPDHRDARAAIAEWKAAWWRATFGGIQGRGAPSPEVDESVVEKLIAEFSGKLAKMGRPIWKIQADALQKTDYAGDVVPTTEAESTNLESSLSALGLDDKKSKDLSPAKGTAKVLGDITNMRH